MPLRDAPLREENSFVLDAGNACASGMVVALRFTTSQCGALGRHNAVATKQTTESSFLTVSEVDTLSSAMRALIEALVDHPLVQPRVHRQLNVLSTVPSGKESGHRASRLGAFFVVAHWDWDAANGR